MTPIIFNTSLWSWFAKWHLIAEIQKWGVILLWVLNGNFAILIQSRGMVPAWMAIIPMFIDMFSFKMCKNVLGFSS